MHYSSFYRKIFSVLVPFYFQHEALFYSSHKQIIAINKFILLRNETSLLNSFNSYAEELKKGYFDNDELWNDPSFRPVFKIVHIMSDICSYWTQIGLLMAFAIERYILICKGNESEILLSKRNRLILYTGTVVCGFVPPTWVVVHFYMLGGTTAVSPK